jgi:hypothetical protein
MNSPLLVGVTTNLTHSPEWDEISEDGKDFIKKLMTEADQRMSAKAALEHPFITKNVEK